MNSTKPKACKFCKARVWEICKFWILQNIENLSTNSEEVWEICKFWILQNFSGKVEKLIFVLEICEFSEHIIRLLMR